MAHKCEFCDCIYKSIQSCKNHMRIKHCNFLKSKPDKKQFICDYCQKHFARKSNLNYHQENACKNRLIVQQPKTDAVDLQNQINELKKELVELKNTKTKHNIINNGTIINNIIYINKTGTENLLDLNDIECAEIFSKEFSSVVSLVKFINFNERLPSNHSFCSKSLEGKYLLAYDFGKSKIESTRKKYFYHELLANSVDKLEILYKSRKNKFSKLKQEQIENNIKSLKDIRNRDFSDKILKEIKNQLVELSYNCKNTVLNTWKNYRASDHMYKSFGHDIKNSNIIEDDSDSELSELNSSESDNESDEINLKSIKL